MSCSSPSSPPFRRPPAEDCCCCGDDDNGDISALDAFSLALGTLRAARSLLHDGGLAWADGKTANVLYSCVGADSVSIAFGDLGGMCPAGETADSPSTFPFPWAAAGHSKGTEQTAAWGCVAILVQLFSQRLLAGVSAEARRALEGNGAWRPISYEFAERRGRASVLPGLLDLLHALSGASFSGDPESAAVRDFLLNVCGFARGDGRRCKSTARGDKITFAGVEEAIERSRRKLREVAEAQKPASAETAAAAQAAAAGGLQRGGDQQESQKRTAAVASGGMKARSGDAARARGEGQAQASSQHVSATSFFASSSDGEDSGAKEKQRGGRRHASLDGALKVAKKRAGSARADIARSGADHSDREREQQRRLDAACQSSGGIGSRVLSWLGRRSSAVPRAAVLAAGAAGTTANGRRASGHSCGGAEAAAVQLQRGPLGCFVVMSVRPAARPISARV